MPHSIRKEGLSGAFALQGLSYSYLAGRAFFAKVARLIAGRRGRDFCSCIRFIISG
jgi:hypothetical protein